MTESQDELHPIPLSDPLLTPPDTVTQPLVDPQLDLLPTTDMTWENFERLLLRIAHDVKGLRSVRLFGTRGQAQKGLDVVGINPDGQSEAVQSKKYETFTESDLEAAVSKYTKAMLPFTLAKLAIGVACQAHERRVTELLMELNQTLRPLQIEIWDQTSISDMLRGHPQIVIHFFGEATARRFCDPHRFATLEVANTDAVATADAVLRGPLSAAGAQGKVEEAEKLAEADPGQALAIYQDIQEALKAAGFPAHAAQFDQRVIRLLSWTGEHDRAIRRIMNRLWEAERSDDSLQAENAKDSLLDLANQEAPEGTDSWPTDGLSAALKATEFVALHLIQPYPTVLNLPSDSLPYLSPEDRARTVLFAAEQALGNDDHSWIEQHTALLLESSNEIASANQDVAIRLQLANADVTETWLDLLRSARTGAIPQELGALVLARHARYLVSQGRFEAADAAWSEAIQKACLSLRHNDAADWLYSQRFVATRQHYVQDKWHPLAASLSRLGSRPRITTSADQSREGALAALQQDQLRRAAIYLRRYLCDAIRAGSIGDERDARRLLGEVYVKSGQHELAAHHLIQAASYESARTLAETLGDTFLDVSEYTKGSVFWIAATAFEFAAAQADVIPDEQVDAVVDTAIDAINRIMAGTQADSAFLSPQLYLSTFKLIAALSDRLTVSDGQRVLALLEGSITVEEGYYRPTDESHIAIAVGIASHNNEIRDDALRHLVGLFQREPHHFGQSAGKVLEDNLDTVGTQLRQMASEGHSRAAALLAGAQPGEVSIEDAESAAARLREPTSNTHGRYSFGTNAIAKSLLARTLPAADRAECMRMLLSNAQSLYEGAGNRNSYLLAAVNLSNDLEGEHYDEFFPIALALAAENPPSEVDDLHTGMRNPLGVFRRSGTTDSRNTAVYLAAVLARTDDDKRAVRDAVIKLIGVVDEDEEYYLTRALQVLRSELGEIVTILAKSGWALRSLAAITWAKSSGLPAELGEELSRDPNVRVRRALAQEILKSNAAHTNSVRTTLESDPRWSVRSILRSE
jgi:hypothetical protein